MELTQESREAQQTNIYNDNRVQVVNINQQPVETRVIYQTTADYDKLAEQFKRLMEDYNLSIKHNSDITKIALDFQKMAIKAEAENKELKRQLKALTQGNINGDTVEL